MTASQPSQTPQNKSTKQDGLWRGIGAATVAPFGVTALFQMINSAETTTEIPDTAPETAPAQDQGTLLDPVLFGFLGTAVLLIGLYKAIRNERNRDNALVGFSWGMIASTFTALSFFAASQIEQSYQEKADIKTEISADEVIASQPSQQQAAAPTTYIYQPGP